MEFADTRRAFADLNKEREEELREVVVEYEFVSSSLFLLFPAPSLFMITIFEKPKQIG